ncbi:glycosyltransferase [Patescibacteria group bacterium]|nr:glycosyltransferase [Patescibacteria group bacterium]
MASINPQFSILIPTYNGESSIVETINSLVKQNYPNLEIIVSDDCSTDNTLKFISKLRLPYLKIISHSQNVGYPANLERGRRYCHGEILLLMGQDDLLSPGTIKYYISLFKKYPQVGAITRPYYWFDKNSHIAVRRKKLLNSEIDEQVSIKSPSDKIIRVFDSLDQLSGLAFRCQFMDTPFHPDIFPCHIYPFASIFKKHPIIYVHQYNTAVRISSSQTRKISSIYSKSPILSWKQMVDSVYPENTYYRLNQLLIKDFIACNYIGLVQIKNYGKFSWVIREIIYLIRFRWQNLFSPYFWLISFGVIFIPANLLIPLVDWYKNNIYRRVISQSISYSFSS